MMKDGWDKELVEGDEVYYMSKEAPWFFCRGKITSFKHIAGCTQARIGRYYYMDGAMIHVDHENAAHAVTVQNIIKTAMLVKGEIQY